MSVLTFLEPDDGLIDLLAPLEPLCQEEEEEEEEELEMDAQSDEQVEVEPEPDAAEPAWEDRARVPVGT